MKNLSFGEAAVVVDGAQQDGAAAGSDVMSRRAWLAGAAAVIAVGAAFMRPMRAVAQQKTKQADAKYQSSPKDNQKCSGCSQFQAPSACKVVEGTISAEGWCQLFTPKSG